MGSQSAVAAELVQLDVERDKDTVRIAAELFINAPVDRVYAVLSDYEGLSQMSERFKEARVEPGAEEGSTRIYTRVEGCVLFFCREVERYALLRGNGQDLLEASVEPEGSDFEYGFERWQMRQTETGTAVDYSHELVPKFWVPPVLGVWAIKRALRKDALKAAQHIEQSMDSTAQTQEAGGG